MRNNTITFVILMLTVISGAVIFLLYENNQDLNIQLDAKQKLLDRVLKSDSLHQRSDSIYSQELKQYVSDDCGIIIDGRNYSTSELVSLLSKNFTTIDSLNQEVHNLKHEINSLAQQHNDLAESEYTYKDSTAVFRTMVRLAESRYGIRFKVNNLSGGARNISTIESKVDSALWLFPYYKHKIVPGRNKGEVKILFDTPKKSN